MADITEGHSEAIVLIRSMKSLREILETATAFEKSARDFYSELIPKVSKDMRNLVKELAEEEQEHFELFAELLSHSDIEAELGKRVQVPLADFQFSGYVHLPELGEFPDDREILQYAIGREDAAMKQYRELADETEPGEIHDLFEFLAIEESKHKLELEITYDELFQNGAS